MSVAITSSTSRSTSGLGTPPAQHVWADDWARQAYCTSSDPDTLFVQGKAQHDAKSVCKRCPVLAECLAEALDNRTEFGVWGGMTERERRALLRRRPDVESWKSAFRAGLEAQRG